MNLAMNEISERLAKHGVDPLVSLIRLAESDRMPVDQAEALLWKIFAMTTTAVVAPEPVEEPAPEIPEEVLECEVRDEPAPFMRKKGAHLKPDEINRIKELLTQGVGPSEIIRQTGITAPTFYRVKSLYGL